MERLKEIKEELLALVMEAQPVVLTEVKTDVDELNYLIKLAEEQQELIERYKKQYENAKVFYHRQDKKIEQKEKEINHYLDRLQKADERVDKLEKALKEIVHGVSAVGDWPEVVLHYETVAKKALDNNE